MHISTRQLNQIRGGRKTQIRVPVREPRQATRKNNTTYISQPFKPEVGATMTLREPPPPRHHEDTRVPVRITITEAREQLLGELSFPDVIAEGHSTTSGFQVWWVSVHDRPWIARRLQDNNSTVPDDMVIDRFHARHADTLVWAIRFEIDRSDRPRILVAAGRRYGDERGYSETTTGAVIGGYDEKGQPFPEAVGVEDVWLSRYAKEARDEHHLRGLERPIEWRLRQALLDAQAAGVDVTRQVLAIEQRIRSIRLRAAQRAA